MLLFQVNFMHFSDIWIKFSVKFSFQNHILHIFIEPMDVSAFQLKQKSENGRISYMENNTENLAKKVMLTDLKNIKNVLLIGQGMQQNKKIPCVS